MTIISQKCFNKMEQKNCSKTDSTGKVVQFGYLLAQGTSDVLQKGMKERRFSDTDRTQSGASCSRL